MPTQKRPSKPWRVIWTTPGGPHTTYHRSERATYDEINNERRRIGDGLSRVTRANVEKWSSRHGRWMHYDQPILETPTATGTSKETT